MLSVLAFAGASVVLALVLALDIVLLRRARRLRRLIRQEWRR